MALKKNPGPLLQSDYRGSIELTPPEYRAKLGIHKTTQQNPVDIPPDDLVGLLIESSCVQERTDERLKTNIFLSEPLTTELPDETFIASTGQVGHRTRSLVPEGTPLVVDDDTYEAGQKNLGNGLLDQFITEVDDVFPGPVYAKSIENLIPSKFRAFIPTKTIEYTLDGTADPDPTLALGELVHEEQQLTVFHKRIKSVTINIVIPPGGLTFSDEETTELYGGGVLDVIMTLAPSGTLTIDTGLRVTESQLTDLGNGYEIKLTKRLQPTTWFIQEGQDYDDHFDVVLPYTQQVIDANTLIGTPRTEIKPIDRWREQTKTVDITEIQEVLDDYVLSYVSKVNVDMPDKLIAVEGVEESSTGEGTNDETGDYTGTGSFSVSLSLRASAQSSAAILFDIKQQIKQFWGSNIECTEYHFFLASPVTAADILTRLTALVGAISNWPKFNPEMVTFSMSGRRVSLQVTASSQGSLSASSSGSSSTTGGGTGYSKEVGLNLKVIRISPTIHGAITMTGDTSDSISLSATASAEATGLGPAESETQSDAAFAAITPTSIPATLGATDWPTTGLYLYKVDAQPYRFGYVQIHCVVVDAANFPTNP